MTALTPSPDIEGFFDPDTSTVTYWVSCPVTQQAALIDPVLGYHFRSARTDTRRAQALLGTLKARQLTLQWILETHAHADHLSAAHWIRQEAGGRIGLGFAVDGRQFDHLFEDGETFRIGQVPVQALWVPGHTPTDMAYCVGGAVFAGDTLFQPDVGTARADFPGGDARMLFRSVGRLLALPSATRILNGHDHPPQGARQPAWEATVARHRAHNIHVHDGVTEDSFVALREARDATLDLPDLILPALQVNIRAGALAPPDGNGMSYLRLPLNALRA